MTWRSVFGLDPVEFIIFWASAITASVTIGVLSETPEITFLLLVGAAAAYVFLRRRAMRHLPPAAVRDMDSAVAQMQDDQAAATEYFERRIAELEERLDFTERMLARQHSPDQIGS